MYILVPCNDLTVQKFAGTNAWICSWQIQVKINLIFESLRFGRSAAGHGTRINRRFREGLCVCSSAAVFFKWRLLLFSPFKIQDSRSQVISGHTVVSPSQATLGTAKKTVRGPVNFHAETSCPERQTLPALTTCNISSCPGKPLASPLRVCAYRRGSLSRGIDAATALLSVLCALCFSSKCEAWQRASPLAAVQQAHQGHCGHLEDGTQHRVPRPTMKTLARRYWKCLHLACVDA